MSNSYDDQNQKEIICIITLMNRLQLYQNQMTNKEKTGFAIQPKLDCPHLNQEKIDALVEFLVEKDSTSFSEFQCIDCQDKTQNWICLTCKHIGCSRYVKGHMSEHNASTSHPIGLSFSDGSYWCYSCQNYIDSPLLKTARITLSNSKFAKAKNQKKQEQHEVDQQSKQLIEELNKLEISEGTKPKECQYTIEDIYQGLKEKKYKNVVVLTGAGLSVAAGIPDFRSPKTGLYSQLQKYNLPYPEAVFEIQFYKKNPIPFIKVAKQCLNGEFKPTLGHTFIKKLQDEGILLMNLTQNIDDLQISAGIDEDKLLQAHGHSRSAHCIKCKKSASIQKWKQCLKKEEPMKCGEKENEQLCEGLVKPDIVFFGEQLPNKFFQAPEIVQKSDLAIVIGTSLKVMPFAYLATIIPAKTPVILINLEDSMADRSNKIWLSGDIQENIAKIMKELKWE